MKRYLKLTLWIGGAVTVLLIVAVAIITLTFDPNKYKPEITAAVQEATGRELAIPGDLKLSLFPWLGVETGAMTLSNPPGFGQEPFAKIGAAAIKVKLLPLFRRELELDTVTLEGLYVHLIRDASGRGNWEDLAAPNKETTATTAAGDQGATPVSRVTQDSVLSSLAIGGIRLQDATVIWDDRQKPARYELSELALHTGPVSPGIPVDLELETQIKGQAPPLSAHLILKTQADYKPDAQELQLKGLRLTTEARAQGLPVKTANLTLNGEALLRLAEQQYRVNNLRLDASLQGAKLPGKRLDAKLHSTAAIDLNKGTLEIDPLSLEAWHIKVGGQIRGQDLLKAPHFSGELAIAPFNPRQLLAKLDIDPPNTADPQALTNLNAKLRFTASASAAALAGIEINADQTRITGEAVIKDFTHPAYGARLAVDAIDADRYLPPPAESATPVTPAAAAGAGAAELPLETLRALDVDGGLTIGKLKIAKLKASDIELGVTAKAGVIRVHPLSARLYGGTYRGDMQLDARGKAAKISVNESLNGIEIGPLTKDLLDKDLVAGTGNVRLTLTGVGLEPEALKRSLNGSLGFSFQDGRVNGVNLIEMIRKDYLKYIQGLAIDPGRLNQTLFSKFAASAMVKNGLIDTKDLVFSSAQLDVKGRGTVNLVDERLALYLEALPRGELAKQLGKYKDTVIPIRVEGTVSAPAFATDLDEMLKRKAKARLEEEKQKLEAELREKVEREKAKAQQRLEAEKRGARQKLKQKQDKLEEQLKDKLKNLFK